MQLPMTTQMMMGMITRSTTPPTLAPTPTAILLPAKIKQQNICEIAESREKIDNSFPLPLPNGKPCMMDLTYILKGPIDAQACMALLYYLLMYGLANASLRERGSTHYITDQRKLFVLAVHFK